MRKLTNVISSDIKSGKRHYSLFLVTHSTPRNHCSCNNCSRFWSEANNGKLKNVAIHRCTFLILSCLLRALSIVQTAYNTFGIIQLSSCVSCVLCPREKIHPPMKDNFVQCTACKRECSASASGREGKRADWLAFTSPPSSSLFQCVQIQRSASTNAPMQRSSSSKHVVRFPNTFS